MIYTVSFNPSLDYVQDLDCVNLGYVNRTSGEKILPGGNRRDAIFRSYADFSGWKRNQCIHGIKESWI